MSVIVREGWYEHYKRCEKNLEEIMLKITNRGFTDFYDKSKERSAHFESHIIDIYYLCNISKPDDEL